MEIAFTNRSRVATGLWAKDQSKGEVQLAHMDTEYCTIITRAILRGVPDLKSRITYLEEYERLATTGTDRLCYLLLVTSFGSVTGRTG